MNASYNVDNIVEIQNIAPDENGEIWVSMTSGPFASYAYIGGIQISSSNRVEDTSNARQAAENEATVENELDEVSDVLRSRLLLYPNPHRNGVLRVVLEGARDEDLAIQVVDLNGKVLLNQVSSFSNGSGYVELENVEELSTGVYVVRIKGEAFGLSSIRLIKE